MKTNQSLKGAILALTLTGLGFLCSTVRAQSLVAHWTFDEASGTTAHDSTGAFNGTLSGGAAFVTGGISGNAISLASATNSLVNMGNGFPGFTTGDFSVVSWIKTSTTTGDSGYISKHEAFTANGYFLDVNATGGGGAPGKALFYASGPASTDPVSTTTITDNTWHQVVGVYHAGGNAEIYVDGAPVEDTRASNPIVANSAPFLIGGVNASGTPLARYTGLVDDVQVYSSALSSSNVQFLFQNPGQVVTPPCTPPPSNLVAWYPGDGNANDIQGGNNGVLQGGVTFAAGKVGQAFSFNGSDGQVVVPHNANQNGGTAITIDAWVNPTSSGHGRPIAQKRSSSNIGGYTFETTHSPFGPDNGLSWVIMINGTYHTLLTPANVLTLGTFQHVAATYDGTTMRIYVNGIEKASMAASGAIDPRTDPIVIGRNVVNPSLAWQGLIDELELFNRALSAAEIQAIFNADSTGLCRTCMAPPANLVSWYPGDGNANDIQSANNGTLINGATFAPGFVGQAFSFNGTGALVSVPDAQNLDFSPSAPITVNLWVFRTGTGNVMHLLGKRVGCDGSASINYQMAFDNRNGLNLGFVSSSGGAVAHTDLPLNTWTHLAGTFDGTNFKLYINGQLAATGTGTLGPTNTAPLEIGDSGTCEPFGGLIDEVEIFNRALTDTEIQAIANAGNAGQCKPLPGAAVQISTRLSVGTGDNTLIVGFIVEGDVPKKVLIRGIGTSLQPFFGDKALADPVLTLRNQATGAFLGMSDNWRTTQIGGIITTDQAAAIEASGSAPTRDAESAILATLSKGQYTAEVKGAAGGTGFALAEIYDREISSPATLANLSTRGQVGVDDNIMISGLFVGNQPTRIVVRALGPTLGDVGVPGAMADPTLDIINGDGTTAASNDNWQDAANHNDIPLSLQPSHASESVILTTLLPGRYTVQLRGSGRTMGNALIEAYVLK